MVTRNFATLLLLAALVATGCGGNSEPEPPSIAAIKKLQLNRFYRFGEPPAELMTEDRATIGKIMQWFEEYDQPLMPKSFRMGEPEYQIELTTAEGKKWPIWINSYNWRTGSRIDENVPDGCLKALDEVLKGHELPLRTVQADLMVVIQYRSKFSRFERAEVTDREVIDRYCRYFRLLDPTTIKKNYGTEDKSRVQFEFYDNLKSVAEIRVFEDRFEDDRGDRNLPKGFHADVDALLKANGYATTIADTRSRIVHKLARTTISKAVISKIGGDGVKSAQSELTSAADLEKLLGLMPEYDVTATYPVRKSADEPQYVLDVFYQDGSSRVTVREGHWTSAWNTGFLDKDAAAALDAFFVGHEVDGKPTLPSIHE